MNEKKILIRFSSSKILFILTKQNDKILVID